PCCGHLHISNTEDLAARTCRASPRRREATRTRPTPPSTSTARPRVCGRNGGPQTDRSHRRPRWSLHLDRKRAATLAPAVRGRRARENTSTAGPRWLVVRGRMIGGVGGDSRSWCV